jgi:hypothetical protein
MARRPKYEELVPDDVRKLAEGVGLPRPTWYEGRTNGHTSPPKSAPEAPHTQSPEPADAEPAD